MIKIINVYITPLIEYGVIVWSQNRITSEKRVERILHGGTRIALNAPYRHDHGNYIDFQQRLRITHMLTYSQRRTITSIIYILKIMQGILETELSVYVNECCHNTRNPTRSPHIFDIKENTIPRNSPLYIGTSNANRLRQF